MLSRVAESIFWMCRYIERAENIGRFVNVNWHLMLDGSAMPQELQWMPLVSITGDEDIFKDTYADGSLENVIHFLTFDQAYPNSILSCLRMARENARSVREIIPMDLWEQVNKFYHMVDDAAVNGAALHSPHEFFTQVVGESNKFIGLTLTTMMHDEGWNFCRAGRMLERADKTSRILDVKYFYLLPRLEDVGSPIDQVQWAALLRSASALHAYRQTYGAIEPSKVIEILLLDRQFPRSVRYCVDRVLDSLREINGSPVGAPGNAAERQIGQLAAELAYRDVREVVKGGLHEYIDSIQLRLNQTGNEIFDAYFKTTGE